MTGYYDSSLILSLILEERSGIDYEEVWERFETRLSSNLMRFECIAGLRRAAVIQGVGADDAWVGERLSILEEYFENLNFKLIDDSIEMVLRDNAELADCRCLDAVHLATALYFRAAVHREIFVCSLDHRMRDVAERVGLQVMPQRVDA